MPEESLFGPTAVDRACWIEWQKSAHSVRLLRSFILIENTESIPGLWSDLSAVEDSCIPGTHEED